MTPRKSGVILNNSIPSFVVIYQRNVSWHLDPIPNLNLFLFCRMLYSAMNWPAVSSHATEQWSDSFGVLSTPLDCYSADHFKGKGGESKFFWYILFFGYLLNFILKNFKSWDTRDLSRARIRRTCEISSNSLNDV